MPSDNTSRNPGPTKKATNEPAQQAKVCIFCGGTPLSKTHVWPRWLGQAIPDDARQRSRIIERVTHTSLSKSTVERIRQTAQGSLFSFQPRLACEGCNTGWMNEYEKEILKFSSDLILSNNKITLNLRQMRVFAVWISLIAILAEYMDRKSVTISEDDRLYIMKAKKPPPSWSIFIAGTYGPIWARRYIHRTAYMYPPLSVGEAVSTFHGWTQYNTQISSFGIGKLFVHVFSCPAPRVVSDFEIAVRAEGLTQIWPPPKPLLWPISKPHARLPPKITLTDMAADYLERRVFDRLDFYVIDPPT